MYDGDDRESVHSLLDAVLHAGGTATSDETVWQLATCHSTSLSSGALEQSHRPVHLRSPHARSPERLATPFHVKLCLLMTLRRSTLSIFLDNITKKPRILKGMEWPITLPCVTSVTISRIRILCLFQN